MPFRARSVYFLYLLAHFSFYFQQIHFQTFFHLPSLLLSCCFFCTQGGNLFWKRYFNRSHSEQSFCLLAHLYLKYISSSQGTASEHMMRYFTSRIPRAKCSLAHAICKPFETQQQEVNIDALRRKAGGKTWIEVMLRYEISNIWGTTDLAIRNESSTIWLCSS